MARPALLLDRPLTGEHRADGPVVVGRVAALARDDAGWTGPGWATLETRPPVRGDEVELVAIAYHLWANRGPSVMRIFTPARDGGNG